MEWQKATIFISSTFNDMHAERDYLIKEVFPELNEWCERRKIRLSDVDLRWGVKEEDTENKATVGTCLRHIDKSRPFFLCFLGQRRGWVPDFNEDINDETKEIYPAIDDLIKKEDTDRSVTEMEIEHSLLSPMYRIVEGSENTCPPTQHTLFFFRDDDYLSKLTPAQKEIYTNNSADDPAHADEKLEEIKEKIIKRAEEEAKLNESRSAEDRIHVDLTYYKGEWDETLELPELSHFENGEGMGRLTNFKCGEESLKDVLINQLKKQLTEAFPDNIEIQDETEFEKDLNQQEIFCYLNSEGYIARPTYSNKLTDYINDSGENKICLVSAEAGYGKTMLLAKFVTDFEEKNSDVKLYKRFCGASNLSSNTYSLWKSIIEESKIELPEDLELSNIDDLKRNMSEILKEIAKDESLIIIDAVNQMENGMDMLKWFDELPDNLKIIASIKEDKNDENYTFELDKIKNRSYISDKYSFEIEKLDDNGKKELIRAYLKNYLKELDETQINEICKFEGSKNPLFLKILLAELRVFGSFDQLKEKIGSFGDSPLSAFDQVLERLENDEKLIKGDNIVPLLFALMAYSRYGLSEEELVSIIKNETTLNEKEIQDSIRIFIRQVRPFMAIKEARHDFFYESFDLATKNRYGISNIEINKLLADYFKKQADPDENYSFKGNELRPYNELPYHLFECGQSDTLDKTLSSYSFIKNKLDLSDVYNLVSDYQYNTSEEEDSSIELIGRALELSSPVLKDNKNQLPPQLQARMCEIDDEVVQGLLDELENKTQDKWLKSTTNALYSPKSSIIKRIKADGRSATAIVLTSDNKLIIGTDDGKLNLYRLNDNYLDVIGKENSEIIKIILDNDDKEMVVASKEGIVKRWNIADKKVINTYDIKSEITDIYISKTYGKIYASSHNGVFSIDIKSEQIKTEPIDAKDYNQILVPRRNEAILVCDEKEVDGWDVYEKRKAYNQHHQHEIGGDESDDKSFATQMDSSGDIKFMGLNKRFLTLISENGQMKFWNTLKNSESGQSIDEVFTSSLNDKFANAITIEKEDKIITMSEMGVLNEWDIPNPKKPNFTKATEIQTGIKSSQSIEYFTNGSDRWVVIGNKNNDINVIDLNKKVEDSDHMKHGGSVLSIILSDDNMITASEDGEFYNWSFANESCDENNQFSNDFRNECVAFDESDKKLFSAGVRHEKDGRKINKISTWQIGDGEAKDYKTNPDPIVDITQNSLGTVFIEKNKLVTENSEEDLDGNATSLCSQINSSDVFIGFEDGKIQKYSNGLSDFAKSSQSPITKMDVISDKLIAGYNDGTIGVFGLDGTHITNLKENEKAITNFASLNGEEFISVCEDGTLKFWNIGSGESTYTYFLDIYATSVNVRDDKLVVGDTLGNVRFFSFENF